VVPLEQLVRQHGQEDVLRSLYEQWGFKTLLAGLEPPRQSELFCI